MSIISESKATLDDLLRTEGKAELIGGRIVRLMPSGHSPSQVAFETAVSLREYARTTGRGVVYADGMGFTVPELPSGRQSFCPDAAYFVGPLPKNRMRFIQGAPTFAVEARSENDYGPAAERALADKRADYFAAGTLVVWDVDCTAEVIHVYRASNPAQPTTYARGQCAEAEPAVPGWTIGVDEVFGEI
jgi:Putative restriction endonuclease